MKIKDILLESVVLDAPKLTQCLTRFILSNRQRWRGQGVENPNTMFARGLCGMWAYFAKRIAPFLEVEETQDHVWVRDPTTNLLYDAHTPQGTRVKKRLRGFMDDERIGPTEKGGANRWGKDISTGNFSYTVGEKEEQVIINCYHGKSRHR